MNNNIEKKYGLPSALPTIQNGKLAPIYPLYLEHRGDNVYQFGGKYIGEIVHIYELLYKILTHQEIDVSFSFPYAIKITEDKLYIRNEENTEWVLIFDITKPNFPKEIELYDLIYKAISHKVIDEDNSFGGQFKIENNILYVRDEGNTTWNKIGDVTKEFFGATQASIDILDQINSILEEIQNLKSEVTKQVSTANETLNIAMDAANQAMTNAKSINIRTFPSVSEMKNNTTLKAGALISTQGYFDVNDGGGTNYVVVDSLEETEQTDDDNIIELQNGLYAKYLVADARNKVVVFNTVADMKTSNKVKAGYTIRTLGYHSVNDGGAADYVIVDDIGDEQPDDGSIIALQKNLYAKLLITDYVNVKWFGAYGDGIHDDTKSIQKALALNKILNIPEGIYYVNFTEAITGILAFNEGILKGNIIFNNAYIRADLKQIFSIDSIITGTLTNNKIYPQWWGAMPLTITSNNTSYSNLHSAAKDISTELTKCIEFANNQAAYGKPTIKLTNGFWRLDSTIYIEDIPSYANAPIMGNGMNSTILDISGNTNTYGIVFRNTSQIGTGGNSKKDTHGNFTIYGNSNITCVQFYGVVGHDLENIRFNTCKLAVEFRNPASGFTEECNLKHCWFDWFCKQGIKYIKDTSGNDSFRGCGLHACFAETYADVSCFMEITNDCAPYNCELDLHISAGSTSTGGNPLIFLADRAWCPNFYGHITIETDSNNYYLCYGENNTRIPNLFFAGTVQSWGHSVNLGQMFLCHTYFSQSNSAYPSVPFLLPRHYKVTLDTTAKRFFGGHLSNGCLFAVDVSIDNYAYKGLFVIMDEHNNNFLESTFIILVDKLIYDPSSYGKPKIKQSTGGYLEITPPTKLSTAVAYVTVIPLGFDRRYNIIGSTRDNDLTFSR